MFSKIGLAIGSFFVPLLLALSSIASAAPHAVISPREFWAGSIPQGKIVTHEFIIKNTGDKPLILNIGHT
ncbi:MAG: hypothetical protein J7J85_00415 [Deltaproteobacteria bacterium]|nr:hypothetical protein [Deltaproteobacteria bacterium]